MMAVALGPQAEGLQDGLGTGALPHGAAMTAPLHRCWGSVRCGWLADLLAAPRRAAPPRKCRATCI